MMKSEGLGTISPTPVAISILPGWKEYAEAEARRRQNRDNNRSDTWGKGCIPNAHLVGLLGEIAACMYYRVPCNLSDQHDPGFDFLVNGIKIDVKTTATSEVPLVRQDARQRCHVYLMARVNENEVTLLGWCPWGTVQEFGTTIKSRYGPWMNKQVHPAHLQSPSTLVKYPTTPNLIRYPGGKSRLWSHLKKYIARGDMFSPSQYFEPFVGGGAILRKVLDGGSFRSVCINDLDYSLSTLWTVVRDFPLDLSARVLRWHPNVADWNEAKHLDGDRTLDKIDTAFLKLVLHFGSHGGLGFKAGGPQGGARQQSKYPIGCRWHAPRIVQSIQWFSKQLQGAQILNVDFRQVTSPDSFVFADPPYVAAGSSLYRHSFCDRDHTDLRDWLFRHDDWAVTYDDHPLIRNLYQDCHVVTYENNTGNNRKHNELLITSF